MSAACVTRSGTLAKARSTSRAMNAPPELGRVAADNAAAPQVRACPIPTRLAVGLLSLKELVEQYGPPAMVRSP